MKQNNTETKSKTNSQPKKRVTKPKTRTNNKVQSKVQSKPKTKKAVVPVPEYQVPDVDEVQKQLSFSRLIPNENLIQLLEKSSYSTPSEELNLSLPAVLRTSDTMIYKTKQSEDFLIGTVPAYSFLLQANHSENINTDLKCVFFTPNELESQSVCKQINETFYGLNLNAATELSENKTDILITTPEKFLDLIKNNALEIKNIALACFYDLESLSEKNHNIQDILSSLKKAQKVFLAYKNAQKVRALAFEFLENPETFFLLPRSITEESPRQFAHALETTKKFQVLLGYLKTYKPRAALVVANSRAVAEWIAFKLQGNSVKVSLITTPLSSHQSREELINKFAHNELNIIVTTDFSLKNLAIENFHCIYHFDLPDDPNLYIARLNKIEGARIPISIAFICEDYGFNMGKIEDNLGFKIKLTRPDKNFFTFEDKSEYPLHDDGRVKTIIEKQKTPILVPETITSKPEETKPAPSVIVEKPQITEQKQTLPTEQKTPSEHKTTKRHHVPDTSKFVRRDERAREAVADAVFAAKKAEQKRKTTTAKQEGTTHSSTDTAQGTSVVSSVFSVLFDAVKAGAHATKQSFIHNTEEKLPKLHKFFTRSKK